MLLIGHRGAKGLAPENTLASFKAALEAGVDGIEFDVRVSKDGVAVLNHNSDIGIPGFDLDIAKTDYKDLKKAKPDFATLDEALDFIDNRTTVVIEVKYVPTSGPVAKSIKRALKKGWDGEKISVSSFHFKILRAITLELPDIRVVVNEGWSGIRATRRARKLGTEFITMNQRWLWSGFIRAITRRGFKLSSYTINNPAKAQKWADAGLYAAITDFPDRFHLIRG